MKIDKKIVTKIEGEATLKIFEKDDIIEFVEIEFWQYRGIEDYLINRHFLDALVINPRICGICGHSHLLATAKAIEDALNIIPSKKATILRDITVGLEIVQNHLKWFYITLFPTQIKKRCFFKALDITSLIAKTIALIGGQYPHNSYIVPGGVTCDLTNLEILKIKENLKLIENMIIKNVIDYDGNSKDLDLFFENLPKDIGKSLNKFLVLGSNLYFKPNGDIKYVKEEKNTSLSKNVLYKDSFVEVGPLARNLENNLVKKVYQVYQDSIYTRVFARLIETILITSYLIKKIDEIDICEENFRSYKNTSGKGKSVIEAPRGSLIHEIEIENEKIKRYNIIVPTQFNLSSSTKENPSSAQKALIGEDKKYIDSIFKCFDICAVCVSH